MDQISKSNSLNDIWRHVELPPPQELRHVVRGAYDVQKPFLVRQLEQERVTCRCCAWTPRATVYKNLLGVAVSYMIIFSAFLAVLGLQASINEGGGLGLTSSSVVYALFFFSGLYTPSIMRLLGSKYAMVLGYVAMSLYTVSNYYRGWISLMLGSVCLGVFFGPLWASLNIHITKVALRHAPDLNEAPSYLIGLFTGVLTLFYKLAYIPANIASAAILFNSRNTTDTDIFPEQGDECNNTEAANVEEKYIYMLISVYVAFDIVAIAVCVIFVDHLGSYVVKPFTQEVATQTYLIEPTTMTLKMLVNKKMVLILPMMIMDGYVISITLGQLAKVSYDIILIIIIVHVCYVNICRVTVITILLLVGGD